VRHHHRVVRIDLAALPDDPDSLQQTLREAVPERKPRMRSCDS
jgi:hypothetical protein